MLEEHYESHKKLRTLAGILICQSFVQCRDFVGYKFVYEFKFRSVAYEFKNCCVSYQRGSPRPYMRPHFTKWNSYLEYFKGKLAHMGLSRDRSVPKQSAPK